MSAEEIENTLTSPEHSAEFADDEMVKAAISILITKDQLTVSEKFINWLTKRDKLELMMPLVCNGLLSLDMAKQYTQLAIRSPQITFSNDPSEFSFNIDRFLSKNLSSRQTEEFISLIETILCAPAAVDQPTSKLIL